MDCRGWRASDCGTHQLWQALGCVCLTMITASWSLDAADEPDPTANVKSRLARMQFELGIRVRDQLQDPIRAGHLLLHAGLAAEAAGDEQLLIDAGHAAQDCVNTVAGTMASSCQVGGTVLSPDGSLLASWDRPERLVEVWSLSTHSLLASKRFGSAVQQVAFHPRDPQLAIVCRDEVAIWAVDSENLIAKFTRPDAQTAPFDRAIWHDSGENLLILDKQRHCWDWRPGQPAVPRSDDYSKVADWSVGLGWNPDRRFVWGDFVVARQDHLEVWNSLSGQKLAQLDCEQPPVAFLLLEQNQTVIYSCMGPPGADGVEPITNWAWNYRDNTVRPWDAAACLSPKHVAFAGGKYFIGWGTIERPKHSLAKRDWVRLNPGQYAFSKQELVFRKSDGTVLQRASEPGFIEGYQLDKAGKRLAIWTAAGRLTIWVLFAGRQTAAGYLPPKFGRHLSVDLGEAIREVAFHPYLPPEETRLFDLPSSSIAVVTASGRMQLFEIPITDHSWGPEPTAHVLTSVSPPERIRELHWSPDGQTFITRGDLQSLRVWNMAGLDDNSAIIDRGRVFESSSDLTVYPPNRLRINPTNREKPPLVLTFGESTTEWRLNTEDRVSIADATPDGSHVIIQRIPKHRLGDGSKEASERFLLSLTADPDVTFELYSLESTEPLRTWKLPRGPLGPSGFRWIDNDCYLQWNRFELRLASLHKPELTRVWTADLPIMNVTVLPRKKIAVLEPLSAGDSGLTAMICRYDTDEPLQYVPAAPNTSRLKRLGGTDHFLVTRFDGGRSTIADVISIEPEQRVELDRFQGLFVGCDDNLPPKYLLSTDFRNDYAWLHSATTGQLLARLGEVPKAKDQQTYDPGSCQIDPSGRFVIKRDQLLDGTRRQRLQIYMTSRLQPDQVWQPDYQYLIDDCNRIQLRPDGTFLIKTKDLSRGPHRLELRSCARGSLVLRNLQLSRAIHRISENGPGTDIFGFSGSRQIFRWSLKTWTIEDIRRELAAFEQRTRLRLDPHSGELAPL